PCAENEIRQLIPVSTVDERGAGGGDLAGEPVRYGAEGPPRPAGGGDGDRAVPVLHRGVRLAPEPGRLAALERRFVGEADRPAGTEEADLLDGARIERQRGPHGLGRLGRSDRFTQMRPQ